MLAWLYTILGIKPDGKSRTSQQRDSLISPKRIRDPDEVEYG
jgi:hypothetical protein